MEDNRIIVEYEGPNPGPLLICLAGVHGNEPAGLKALSLLGKMLDVEPITNPGFRFNGKILGIHGNLKASETGTRFIDYDLNRLFTVENISQVRKTPVHNLTNEWYELRQIVDLIDEQIESYQPEKVVFLDLHTTTAGGGIFAIVTDDKTSLEIGKELQVPVIKGMLEGLKGTTLHYYNSDNFKIPITSVCFESGQHNDPLSVNRAIASVLNCMRSIGNVDLKDVESLHDKLLIQYSKDLPLVSKLLFKYEVKKDENFIMKEGYENFQMVEQGEWLANNKDGKILAPEKGLLLMPLYQNLGDDGFFIIRPT
jgi:succinylglutamate desuccinylase